MKTIKFLVYLVLILFINFGINSCVEDTSMYDKKIDNEEVSAQTYLFNTPNWTNHSSEMVVSLPDILIPLIAG